jgi:hypothetical protein
MKVGALWGPQHILSSATEVEGALVYASLTETNKNRGERKIDSL